MSIERQSQERLLKTMLFYRQRRSDAIDRAIAKEADSLRQQVEVGRLSLFHAEARLRFFALSAATDYAEFKEDYSEELAKLWKMMQKE